MDDYMSKPLGRDDLVGARFQRGAARSTALERTAPTSLVLIDAEAIAKLRELEELGTPGLVPLLVESFGSGSRKLLTQIEESIASGELEGMRRAAHTLKSGSAQLGAVRVSELALALEKSEGPDNVGDFADALSHAFDEAIAALGSLVSEGETGE